MSSLNEYCLCFNEFHQQFPLNTILSSTALMYVASHLSCQTLSKEITTLTRVLHVHTFLI